MFHALLINLAIIAAICMTIVLTSNPLALLALMFLKEMPFGLLMQPGDDDEEGGNPIGFIHHSDKSES